jgi:C-terminal processing protease CtpA/Prc
MSSTMKWKILWALVPALLVTGTLIAGGNDATEAPPDEADYQAMLEEAERARAGAEAARREAMKAAELARETARLEAELARREAEVARARAGERDAAREQQREEVERARTELSKAHRELREASREVARAHRELARSNELHRTFKVVNLGDRAVIGVVLGGETPEGVEIIGISPDGPADRAGLQTGDVLVSLRGTELVGDDSGREKIYDIMDDVGDGEELAVEVLRDGESLQLTIVAEKREPSSWQSMIHLSDVDVIPGPDGEREVIVERIEIPEIDRAALEARVAEMAEKLKEREMLHAMRLPKDVAIDGDWEFEFHEFSDLADDALREANVWFGLPYSQGLELATINEGLGAYFDTDHGVLVIRAREDNAYQLRSGDVILKIGPTAVDSPSDMMRALRELEPGTEITIEIKRDRRDMSLSAVMPENRLGFLTPRPR